MNAGQKCLHKENVEVLIDQYKGQIQLHSDVFNADIIDQVENVLGRFLARGPIKSIKLSIPEEVI